MAVQKTVTTGIVYHAREDSNLRVIVDEVKTDEVTLRRLDNGHTFTVKPIQIQMQWVIDDDQTVTAS